MKNRVLALLLILCLILSAAPVSAGAATGQQVSAGAVTVTAGNTAYVTLQAGDFENVAALDVYIYYDPAVFTVSGTSNGSMLSGAQTSVNTAENGKITLSMMSLNGISGTGKLLEVRFRTKSDCTPGTYPITVAIGRAYDSGLSETTVGGVNGSVTVNERVETEYFDIYGYTDKSTLRKGDTLSYSVKNNGYRSFVSGEFTVEYDHEVFAFDSVTLGLALTREGAVYSVNSSVLGQVRIAYANDNPVNSYDLFTVKLTVIADKNDTTTLKVQATNMYRQNLTTYLPDSISRTVTLTKLPPTVDCPNAFFLTDRLVVGKQSQSVFCLEAGAGVAAADFTITYDCNVLRCVNVTMAEGLDEKGGMVVVNDKFADGTIHFSYVNTTVYGASDLPLVQILWEPVQSPEAHYIVTSAGVGVVDAQMAPVTLEYVKDTGCVYVATVTEPTCQKEGQITYLCACGDAPDADVLPKLKEEDCTHYTVTFQYEDGTVIAQYSLHYGDIVTQPKTPAVPDDLGDEYVFSGWDNIVNVCQGNTICTAIFGLRRAPGDIDGDDVVDTDDVVQLLLHVSMPDLFPIFANADFTGDKNVSTDDVVQLLLHVSMPDLFPLQVGKNN